ncbi:hypothetical protein ACA910_016863 [Epithemia clementina (nom. ined.)]
MFKVFLFVAHQDHQVLLEWETGESTFETTTANASKSSLLFSLKILVSTMSSSRATQSCQNLYNFHKNMKWETLTLETFKDAQYFKTLRHAWKTDKVHDQWELGQVLNASSAEYPLISAIVTVGHHLNRESTYVSGLWGVGFDTTQLSGLVHFHKSAALPKLVDGMEMCDPWHGTSHQFLLLLQDQVPDLCCVKVLDTKDSSVHQHDFQDQGDYAHLTSSEVVDPIFDSCNTSQGYFDAINTALGSGVALLESKVLISVTVHNNPKSQVGYQIQDHKEAVDPNKKQDDTSKSYGKACWAIGTVALTYLVIELSVHGHLTKDHFFIATFLSEFHNLSLWGAAIGNANLLKILLSETIISPTQSKEWIMSLLENVIPIIIGNNLWGNITNIPLFDDDGIFMAHHDWGGHQLQYHYFDWIPHEFHLWHQTTHVTAYLLAIFMSLVDWGDTYLFSPHFSHPHHLPLHHHVHQVIAPVKGFTVSQLQHKINTADTLNRFIWYVRDILPFWYEFKDSTKSTQPTHHALWGVIHFPPYGVKVVVAMRAV